MKNKVEELSSGVKNRVLSRVDDRVVVSKVETPRGPRVRLQLDCSGDGVTEQGHKKLCDVNAIMAKYVKTGLAPQMKAEARYEDVSGLGDYFEALLKVNAAHDSFMSLPAELRKQYDNDPGKFIQDMERKAAAKVTEQTQKADESKDSEAEKSPSTDGE